MRRPGMMVAAGVLLLFTATAETAEPGRDASQRFAVRAGLEAVAPALADGRFQLRASLARTPSASAAHAELALTARLTPMAGPLCYGPGHVFADSFETSAP